MIALNIQCSLQWTENEIVYHISIIYNWSNICVALYFTSFRTLGNSYIFSHRSSLLFFSRGVRAINCNVGPVPIPQIKNFMTNRISTQIKLLSKSNQDKSCFNDANQTKDFVFLLVSLQLNSSIAISTKLLYWYLLTFNIHSISHLILQSNDTTQIAWIRYGTMTFDFRYQKSPNSRYQKCIYFIQKVPKTNKRFREHVISWKLSRHHHLKQ